MWTKFKQNLILGLTFAQRYKIGTDLDINGKLFLRGKVKKIANSLKTNESGQWTKASLKISTNGQNEIEPKTCLITTIAVTIPPHHISIVQLKAINQAINTKFTSETLLEIEENPFLTIVHSELVLVVTLQRLGFQVPDTSMVVLWNSRGQNLIQKQNMTISYFKEFK